MIIRWGMVVAGDKIAGGWLVVEDKVGIRW